MSAADIRAIYDGINLATDQYWSLDGNLNDPAGGSNGTFNGTGSASYSTGMFGNALNFNGTDNYVSAHGFHRIPIVTRSRPGLN